MRRWKPEGSLPEPVAATAPRAAEPRTHTDRADALETAARRAIRFAMPSEKAKENKQLVALCAACQKVVSVELMTATILRRKGHAVSIPVCDDCRAKGWTPPEGEGEGPLLPPA